jgi:hypothetical protein
LKVIGKLIPCLGRIPLKSLVPMSWPRHTIQWESGIRSPVTKNAVIDYPEERAIPEADLAGASEAYAIAVNAVIAFVHKDPTPIEGRQLCTFAGVDPKLFAKLKPIHQ